MVCQVYYLFGFHFIKKGDPEPRIVRHNVTVCINMETFEKIDIPDWFRQILKDQMGKHEN
ncbi:hypothetical protein ACFL36_03585 [Thermodesulfobacteriota bacterium]